MGPNQTLVIRLTAKDDGSLVVERLAGKLDNLGKETEQAATSARKLKGDLGGVQNQLSSLTNVVRTFVGAWLFKEIVGGMGSLVRQGLEFNATMQTSRLGMAALVSGLAEVRDSQGRVLQGQERWNAALGISEQLQQKLKTAALQTTANYEDLVKVMQVGLGPMFGAGITNPDDIVELTKRVAQAGGAMGIPGDRLGQEIKALLKGERGPDNELANALLGDITKADFDRMRETGELLDFLMTKLESFAKAGEQAGDTLHGALSNLQDAFGQALGAATQDNVGGVTAMLKDLTAEIVTFDEKGRAIFNEDFVGAIRSVTEGLVWLGKNGVESAKNLERFIDGMAALKDTVTDVHYWLPWGENKTWDENIRERRDARESRNLSRDDRLDTERRIQMEVEQYGEVVSPDLRAQAQLTAKPRSGVDADAAAKLKKEGDKFRAELEKMSNDLAKEQDPIAATIARFEKDRAELLALAGKHGSAEVVNAWIDQQIAETSDGIYAKWSDAFVDAASKGGIDSAVAFVTEHAKGLEQLAEISADIQSDIEADRIAAIKDGIERERRERIKAIEEEAKARLAAIAKSGASPEAQAKARVEVELEAQRQIDKANEESHRKQQEQILATKEYWEKLAKEVTAQYGTIAGGVATMIRDQNAILANEINGFLDAVTSGHRDMMESLESLAKGLGATWTREFTNILMRGQNVWQQLKELFGAIHVKNGDGSTDYMGTALQGAGFGAAVGGIFQGPNNYAAAGGSIGGGIGAALGAAIAGYFTGGLGAGAGAQIGAVIGTVIGTAIGSFIQKGQDDIKIAIQDGVASVIETGISAEGRRELEVQITRQAKEEMKAWQSILDLFPKHIREQLRAWQSEKGIDPSLNLTGGVEGADLTDENALGSLGDFLGKDLPEAAFDAYETSIRKALSLMGVQGQEISTLFEYWGTLQGNELQEAVRGYVMTLLTAVDLRDKIGGDLHSKLDEITRSSATGVNRSQQIREEMADIFSDMANLTDVEDRIAAQQELNRLSDQYYQQSLANLQEINALQRSFVSSIEGQREQIALAGMDDQEKLDFFYQRMWHARDQMAMATDPREIARWGQEAQRYAGLAFGVAPDNEENRQKLDAFLAEILGLGGEQFDEARRIQQEEDLRAAKLLQDAAAALLGAADALNPENPTPTPTPGTPPPGGGDGPAPGEDNKSGDALTGGTSSADFIATIRRVQELRDALHGIRERVIADHDPTGEELERRRNSELAAAIARALAGAKLQVDVLEVDGYIDGTGELIATATAETIAYIRENPDSIESRTGA